jgi:UDPglucose 6-dehydrogenase
LDFDAKTIEGLQHGDPPIFEPGLTELMAEGSDRGHLSFTSDVAAVRGADVVWVTFDTPVNEEDVADVGFVTDKIAELFPELPANVLVLISSQLPVGTTRSLMDTYRGAYPDKRVSFAYSPENLRLGKAIEVFTHPDRVVVGLEAGSGESGKARITSLLESFTSRFEWMSIESAEMTKHSLNAFLATSIAFINEVAGICEAVGADAKEVQRGLKSEARIGPGAYLNPGAAFSGGTLARDLAYLAEIGRRHEQSAMLLTAARQSNANHRLWVRRKLESLMDTMAGQTVAVWGLTYKPGTDTLRRSDSVELCRWLVSQDVRVQAHDPAVKQLPDGLRQGITLTDSPQAAAASASALVIATAWPDYRSVPSEVVVAAMQTPRVIDANRFLEDTLGSDERIHYASIGRISN